MMRRLEKSFRRLLMVSVLVSVLACSTMAGVIHTPGSPPTVTPQGDIQNGIVLAPEPGDETAQPRGQIECGIMVENTPLADVVLNLLGSIAL